MQACKCWAADPNGSSYPDLLWRERRLRQRVRSTASRAPGFFGLPWPVPTLAFYDSFDFELVPTLAFYDSFDFWFVPTLAFYNSFHSSIVPTLAIYDSFHTSIVPTLAIYDGFHFGSCRRSQFTIVSTLR